ncbi:hypothetical protein MICH65_0667 [Candidatus Chazhemtobacterium aquaticus]|uniref:Uncharacterized protein n=1 Tax=Candidatus Chazhemtobacterium aquaticus TaxID=2715735 RepID=A0A857NHV3_9BACT|nr:hypothetical protein MICH65_0667 [Candidatus Chazhemtobacterium aquaticus]
MRLTKKRKRIFSFIIVISSLALLASSFLPLFLY